MHPRALPFALALALATGCAAYAPFRCPARGGAAWRELSTPGFVVRTDLPEPEARALVLALERLDAVVNAALLEGPPPRGEPLPVVVFRSWRELRDVAGSEETLAFYLASPDGDEAIVMWGALAEESRASIAHELTHRALARRYPRLPPWFSEGTASFMESLGRELPGASASLGGIPKRFGRTRIRVPAATILRASSLREPGYGTAWALVYLLHLSYRAELGALEARYARGEDPAEAWRAVFPRWDPAEPAHMRALDAELRSVVGGGPRGYPVERLSIPVGVPSTEVAISSRPLGPAEAHGLRLSLRRGPVRAEEVAAIEAELEEALAEDPGSVVALSAAARFHPAQAAELARAATRAHPDDPRAWRLLARHLPDANAAGREYALRRALSLSPDHPGALALLAGILLAQDRPADALLLGQRAVELAPWNPLAQAALGRAQDGLGLCTAALASVTRAVELVGDGRDDLRDALTAQRAAIRDRCDAAGRPLP
ncbi:MAG: hypothetical protein U0229_20595 [Anaeromyxobacter sp.]